jgi:hypothetical protein
LRAPYISSAGIMRGGTQISNLDETRGSCKHRPEPEKTMTLPLGPGE